jgi:hypothetical protein
MGNISYRRGQPVPFGRAAGTMQWSGDGNQQIAAAFHTIKESLKAAGLDLDKATYQLGPTLKLDPRPRGLSTTTRPTGC